MANEKKAIKRLYDQTLWLVSDYTELQHSEILQSNREECVDARYILIGVLGEYLTDEELAQLTKLTRSCCNKIRNGMKAKMYRYSFRCLFNSVNELVKNLQRTNNETL